MPNHFVLRPMLALLLLAPSVSLAHHEGTAHAEEAPAAPAGPAVPESLGELTVENPWSRATPPMANVAAGYLTIRNAAAEPERLLEVTSDAVRSVEIHLMSMENDVMTMREIEDGLEIPPGGTLELAPGGYHLMLIGLEAPLAEGQRVPVTLRFEAGSIETELAVQGMGARSGPAGHGGH